MDKLFGKGIYNKGKYTAKISGTNTNTNEYQIWRDMLRRCYSQESWLKQPTYIGCSVEPDFLEFQNFAAWAVIQIGFGVHGYQLDKDILSLGGKEYSKDVMCFIPRDLNTFVTDAGAKRGIYPQGVYYDKQSGKFKAQISLFGVKTTLGRFHSVVDASDAYIKAKTYAGLNWGLRLRRGDYEVDERITIAMENYKFKEKFTCSL